MTTQLDRSRVHSNRNYRQSRACKLRRDLQRRFLPCLEQLEDRRLLAVDLVSVTPPPSSPVAANDYSSNPVINANGRFIAFQSYASDLVATDTNDRQDVFLRDLLLGTTTLISVNAEGTGSSICEASVGCSPSGSFDPAISDDGRYVAFVSNSTDLVKGTVIDVVPNVYVRDRDADEDGIFDESGAGETSTTLLSIGTDLTAAGVVVGPSNRPVISGDGKFVIFTSFAVDMLVDAPAIIDTNGFGGDLYRASVDGGPVTRINVDGTGSGTGFNSGTTFDFSTNLSGGLVAFVTSNNGLVSAATGSVDDTGGFDVFVGGGNSPVELVSINSAGKNSGNDNSREPLLSRNGRHVAFFSRATDLVDGVSDENSAEDLFVRDLKTGITTLVSRSREVADTVAADGPTPPSPLLDSDVSAGPVMSDDGRFLAFRSLAGDLLDPSLGVTDGDAFSDIFVLDRDSDVDGIFDEPAATEMILVSVNAAGTAVGVHTDVGIGTAGSTGPSISSNGRYVTFVSTARDLIPGGTLFPGGHVYVRDLWTGVTSMISKTTSGAGVGPSGIPGTRFLAASRDGSRVAFQSDRDASDLDPTVTDPPSGSPVPFGEVDLFAGTPDTDILMGRNFATGFTDFFQSFRVVNEDASEFELGYYRSLDDRLDASDELLGVMAITDPDDLMVDGNRLVFTTIGVDADSVPFPGIDGEADPMEDYFILTVADHLDVVPEFDGDPLNEDNTRPLRGSYQLPGTPVFAHGIARDETFTVEVVGDSVRLTYGITGLGIPRTVTYDLEEGLEVHLRTHGGNDTVIGSDLKEVIFGGEGGDNLRSEGGDDMLFGGPGRDRLDGGEGADTLDGGDGPDTLIGGPGPDIIFDGPGDDTVEAGLGDDVVFSTPGSADVFIDTGGDDTLDFSLASLPITINLDSTAVQTVDSAGNTIRLIGQWENFVGTPFDDDSTVHVKPLTVPRTLNGGGGIDRLILDAGGAIVVNDGTKFSFPGIGLADVSYQRFEQIRVINAAPNTIDDGDPGYLADGFTRQFDPQFLQGFNGDIEFSAANAGNVATWTFNDIPPGAFAVSATWTSAPDRSENARFVVHEGDSNGPILADVRVNQEIAPIEFNSEGIFFQNLAVVPINGNMLTVELFDADADLGDDDPNSFVIADAVRIEPVSSTRIIDNGDAEFSSAGDQIVGFGAFGDLHTTQALTDTSGGVWDCTLGECSETLPDGRYLVSATWPALANIATTEVTFTVTSGDESFTTDVNQFLPPRDFSEAGINWHRLGVIDVIGGVGIRTELTGDAGLLLADAIRIEPAAKITVFDALGDEIPNGGTWNLGQTAIDLDTADATLQDRITIQNSGIADLDLRNLQISGDGYSIVDAGASVLPPGSKTQVEVDFTATALGTFEGQLTFQTNDFDDSRFEYTIGLSSDVIEDDSPPTIEITSPFSGVTFIEGSTIPILVNANDDIKIKAVELRVDGDFVQTDDTFPFDFDFTLPLDSPNVQLTARAIDISGNQTDSEPITINLIEDQPPTVHITQPIDGQGIIEGTPVRVTIDAEDDVGIQSVELFVDSQSVELEVFDPFVFEFVAPNVPGEHHIEARVTDTAGNLVSDVVDFNVFSQPSIHFGSIVVGSESGAPPVVQVFEPDGTGTFSFFPYLPTFAGGVRVASGDVNGDGTPDIITGAGPGGGPHVKVFDGLTGATLHSFFAYDPQFTGGVFVATGDVSGDGFADIITGAGAGGGPHVKVFSGSTGAELASFFAFSDSFTGGVRVATGDVNGDAQDDIIVGAGPGGGPHMRVFDGHTASLLPQTGTLTPDHILSDFFAFDPVFTGGVFVGAGDLNNDGIDDIVVGADQAGSDNGGHVKVIDAALLPTFGAGIQVPDPTLLANFFAYQTDFAGGVRVAAGDVNGDGIADIVTSPGLADPVEVKVFDGNDLSSINTIELGPGFLGSAVVVADRPIAAVVNLQSRSPQHEVDVDNNGVTVRNQDGNVVFFRSATDPPSTIRLNGSPDSDDLLIFRGFVNPPVGPFVFDGGLGGNDAVKLATRSASDPPLQYLKVKLQSTLVTSFSTDRNAGDIDFDFKAIDLEPIEDTLDVVDREFVFANTDDNVVFDTGDDPDDSVLRIDSDHSEVIDFQQASGTTQVQLGGGADVFTFDLPIDQLPTLDGGEGDDALVLAGSGHHLDLTDPSQNKPLNLERINVIGASPNELTIDGPSVISATDDDNILLVVHDEDDTVNYAGEDWQVMPPIFVDGGQRHVLVNGEATVETVNTKPWQNPFAATDVDHSGATTAFDALLIINLLDRFQQSAVVLNTPTTATTLANRYYDVNGLLNNDGQYVASATDALDVINFLDINRPSPLVPTQRLPSPQPEAEIPMLIAAKTSMTADDRNEQRQADLVLNDSQLKLRVDVANQAAPSNVTASVLDQITKTDSTASQSDLDTRDRALAELFLHAEID
ncbi:Ig-like domain-containing protein [Novipirellula sp. SH528]|uniref:Ig-like domain-containing protein n=1 Tax=Novipirellula sp. SH528 TaxID=3454466 RepID=UPI003FA01DD0